MMTDFQKYVERQERCRAIRFEDISQVSEIVGYFNPISYEVLNHPHLSVIVKCRPDGREETLTINYGDYIVEGEALNDSVYSGYRVMDRREFREKFEEAAAVAEFHVEQ